MKFCNDIITAHKIGAFGGKTKFWDFQKDVEANLNRDDHGNRYNENTKWFSQALRIYGGCHLCDLFALNFAGPSYDTICWECRKGVQFIRGNMLKYSNPLLAHMSMLTLLMGLLVLFQLCLSKMGLK